MRARQWLWVLLAVAAVLFLWLLGPVVTPFVVAAGLAYVGDPLVNRLERLHLSRTAAVVVVFAVLTSAFVLLALLLFPVLQEQVHTLVTNLPRYGDWLQQRLQPLAAAVLPHGRSLDWQSLRQLLGEHLEQAGGIASVLFKGAFTSGTTVIALVADLVLIPVITFYMLRDWDRLVAWIRDQLPRSFLPTATELARETDEVLGQFIRGQVLVMILLGLIYTLGLSLAGLNLALVIGLGAGLVSFVPYLGVIVGLTASAIAMLVQTGGELLPLLWVAMVFAVGQTMEGAVLSPLLVGDRIGLHPVTVIFAVLAGGQLFGFVGVLLALPAAAAIAVLVRYAGRKWKDSHLYLDDR